MPKRKYVCTKGMGGAVSEGSSIMPTKGRLGILTDIQHVIDRHVDQPVREILQKYCTKQSLYCTKVAIVSQLIRASYDIDDIDAIGHSPLHQAVKAKDTMAVRFLIQSGCDVNMLDARGQTTLIIAVKQIPCSPETVKTLLTMSKDINVNFVDTSSWNALCYAVYQDNVEVCHLLLSFGASPNSPTISPLYVAIKFDLSLAVIKLLVDNGSYIERFESTSRISDRLLSEAVLRRRIDVIELLCQAKISYQRIWFCNLPFLLGLQRDDLDIVKIFIEKGGVGILSLNSDSGWSNIIHEAAGCGSIEVLRYLIKYSDIDIDFQI